MLGTQRWLQRCKQRLEEARSFHTAKHPSISSRSMLLPLLSATCTRGLEEAALDGRVAPAEKEKNSFTTSKLILNEVLWRTFAVPSADV